MISIKRIENILREFQVKTFGKILFIGALSLGSFTVMNINTPEALADGASEYCRYISDPSEKVNNFTVQLHATEYGFGQNVIARVTNDKAGDVNYRVTLEKQYATGWVERFGMPL